MKLWRAPEEAKVQGRAKIGKRGHKEESADNYNDDDLCYKPDPFFFWLSIFILFIPKESIPFLSFASQTS